MRTALVHGLVHVTLKPVLGPPVPLALQRGWIELLATGAGPAGAPVVVGGRPAERHGPAHAAASVLLLHGGAFMISSPRTHRVLAERLARASGAPVVVPDYRRAPEHPYPAAVDDAVAAYDELAERGPVAVVGDSAGGTLALLLAQVRRPVALGLISPLVDLTGASSAAYRGRDALVRQDWLQQGVAAFAGGRDLPLPVGDALPPTMVQVSEHERLRAEGEQLVQRLRAGGGEAELVLLRALWHDAHLFAHLVPAAAQAVSQLGGWLRVRL